MRSNIVFNKSSISIESVNHNKSKKLVDAIVDPKLEGTKILVSTDHLKNIPTSFKGEEISLYVNPDIHIRRSLKLEDENHDIQISYVLYPSE